MLKWAEERRPYAVVGEDSEKGEKDECSEIGREHDMVQPCHRRIFLIFKCFKNICLVTLGEILKREC